MIIPFFIPHAGCPHQCVFCNQKNITGQSSAIDPTEIQQTLRKHLGTNHSPEPVQAAFYGGSFTALPIDAQRTYLEAVQPFIRSGQVQSIRLSTRPDAIHIENLILLQEHHVSIIELGAQSLDDSVLTLSNRGHTAADTVTSVDMIRTRGFSLGLQLMVGLPGDSPEIFSNTITRTIQLKPDFVRLYPALVIKGTPLESLYTAGRYAPLSLDTAIRLCRDALLRFEDAGIDVIRIGLQPTEELERPGTILAGPFHPAFRQLVVSSIFLERMRELLMQRVNVEKEVTFQVHSRELSAAIGLRRSNIDMLEKEFGLRKIRFVTYDASTVEHHPILLSTV